MPRSTRRTTAVQPVAGKENLADQPSREITTSSKKPRHRLSTTELARLEDVFKQDTHPSRQQKKDLASQLGMDYKTVTIWFQNKRQTAKRAQHPVDKPESQPKSKSDSCLRNVSSPSHNATLDSEVVATATATAVDAHGNSITSRAIIKIKPLLDSLNAITSKPKEHPDAGATNKGPHVQDIEANQPQSSSEDTDMSAESSKHDQTPEHGQTDEHAKTIRWKKVRTLEWACERQTKRRRLSREGTARLESQDRDPNDTHMDPALSLLSLASSPQMGPPQDVIRGASLLLSFKHSWRRK